MKAFTDDDLMPFGKYEGMKMCDVPASYLLWLYDQGVNHPGVSGYIIDAYSALEMDCEDRIKRNER